MKHVLRLPCVAARIRFGLKDPPFNEIRTAYRCKKKKKGLGNCFLLCMCRFVGGCFLCVSERKGEGGGLLVKWKKIPKKSNMQQAL